MPEDPYKQFVHMSVLHPALSNSGTQNKPGKFDSLIMAPIVDGASLVAQGLRIHLPMQEMQVQCLGWEHLQEKEMATNSRILACEI